MARRLTRLARWAILAVCVVTPRVALASSVADELVREARSHEAAHEDDLAVRRYSEAIALDPTLGDAYLGLGALRSRLGDAREAERVYDVALSHLPGLTTAKRARARARRSLHAWAEADADLETYADETGDPDGWRELAGWFAEEGRPLAQLAVWRRDRAAAEAGPAELTVLREARLTVRALELIVGSADPVASPPGPKASNVRRGMARMDRR